MECRGLRPLRHGDPKHVLRSPSVMVVVSVPSWENPSSIADCLSVLGVVSEKARRYHDKSRLQLAHLLQ